MVIMTSNKTDIREEITNQIITLLDKVDLNDYEPPFSSFAAQGIPLNPTTDKQYQGINILSLWFNQQSKSFSSNEWATFKQWKDKGANVRKGQKGSRIIFYKTLIQEEENAKGETQENKIPMLRAYTVFNANQVDGYEPNSNEAKPIDKVQRIKLVEEFYKNTGAEIDHALNRAFYDVVNDYINMPETSSFVETKYADATDNYYATLLHELTHWTGAKHRLDRNMGKGKSCIQDYAFEELIAELGSAFLCAQHGITQTQPEHHPIYIKSWLKALRNDKTHLFKAAAQAMKAVEFLNGLDRQ